MTEMQVRGLTIALHTGVRAEALAFYSALFGRDPDLGPDPDFYEWEISPGAWLQLSTDREHIAPSGFRVRFEVPDIEKAVTLLIERGFEPTEIRHLSGIVSYANLSDPWGNPLGIYENQGLVPGVA
jgi:predicted enzyme related to lactoylglutathione lyase